MINYSQPPYRCWQLAGLISITLMLSACSKSNELNSLERDFKYHKSSQYVNENLKSVAYPTTQKQPHDKTIKQLAIVKNQLTHRKNKASARVNSVIMHNGLYTPSRAMIRQSKTKQSQHQQLKSNASLSKVLSIALKNNLDIKSALDNAKASLARYDQVSFLDDMLAQYASFTRDLKLTGSNQKQKKPVSFPFPGLSTLKANIIDQSVNVSRLTLKQTTQDVITKTRIAYYELQFTRQEITLANKNIKLLNALKVQVKDSYSTYDVNSNIDLATILDVDIQINKNQNTLQIAKQKQHAQQARLNALLNLPSELKLGRLDALKAISINATTANLIKKAKQHRVEIALLQTQLKKLEQIIQLSQKRFYPDLDAGFSRFQSRGSKQQFTTKPKIKINNFFAKNDAYLSETKLRHTALKSKINALKINTEDAVRQALSVYKSQQQSHVLYHSKIIPKAKATLEIAKTLYETGETSYLDVIESKEKILNYQLLSLKAIKDLNVSWAKLARLTGKHL